ncbi:MAG: hypothetical protein KAQ68_11620 [Clostridiales bacterium]|nr:hypothetical protein [Clostridiales bacterium]
MIKKNLPILIAIVLILIVYTTTASPVMQEGNPLPIFGGMIKLSFSDEKIIKISDEPLKYISKTENASENLIQMLGNEGYTYIEQLGAGHFFKRGDEKLTIISVQYSRWYRIFNFP